MPRRFPPIWSVEERDACAIGRDAKHRRSPLLLHLSEQWAGQRRFHSQGVIAMATNSPRHGYEAKAQSA